MSRNIANFATIGIPIISKMRREISGERKLDGTRIVMVANADHFVAIAEFVSQCALTLSTDY